MPGACFEATCFNVGVSLRACSAFSASAAASPMTSGIATPGGPFETTSDDGRPLRHRLAVLRRLSDDDPLRLRRRPARELRGELRLAQLELRRLVADARDLRHGRLLRDDDRRGARRVVTVVDDGQPDEERRERREQREPDQPHAPVVTRNCDGGGRRFARSPLQPASCRTDGGPSPRCAGAGAPGKRARST